MVRAQSKSSGGNVKRTVNRVMVSPTVGTFYQHDYEVLENVALNFFDPQKNSNKFYIAELHVSKAGLGYSFYASHGRVGSKGKELAQSFATLQEAEKAYNTKVKSKLRGGYTKTDLATIAQGSSNAKDKINVDALQGVVDVSQIKATSSLDSAVESFIKHIYAEADQAISVALTGSTKTDIRAPLGHLGVAGITKGREILYHINKLLLLGDKFGAEKCSIEYYRVIPRKLPSNVKVDRSWVLDDQRKVAKELDILSLYEDMLKVLPISGVSNIDQKYYALNTDIRLVQDKETMGYLVDKVTSTHASNHNFRLKVVRAFEVNLKNAPQFNDSVGNVVRLFHGSRSANMVGILSSHLKMPNDLGGSVVKTGAMFGPGLYFASNSTKSANYAFGSFGGRANKFKTAFLMIVEVAMGNVHKVTSPHNFLRPPNGYHSVMGCKGLNLLNNEFIVYNPNQARIRYIVEVEKY